MNKIFSSFAKYVEVLINGKKKIISIKGIADENGCWNCYSHAPDKAGYRRIWYLGRHTRVHRVVYKLFNGSISENLKVCHLCDNPRCFNPDHLTADTQVENIRQMVERNRQASGEKHYKSKLTENDVLDIRASSLRAKELAKKYNVNVSTIRAIINYKAWKLVLSENNQDKLQHKPKSSRAGNRPSIQELDRDISKNEKSLQE